MKNDEIDNLYLDLSDDADPLAWIEFDPDFWFEKKKTPGIQATINKIASHLNVVDLKQKEIISDRAWDLFEIAYEYVGGFKSYSSIGDTAQNAKYIRCVYDGKLANINDFDVEKCLAISIYNSNHGLKMTALASNRVFGEKIKVKAAALKLQRESLKISWIECSDKAESFAFTCGAAKYLIDPRIIRDVVYPDRGVEICEDSKHYFRIVNGVGKIKKIAVGTIHL